MDRSLQAELLDELPATDPRAVHSRRDLRRVNAWMGNARAIARRLQQAQPVRLVELGAGDGTFLLEVARRCSVRGVDAILVDRSNLLTPETKNGFATPGWTVEVAAMDVFDWLESNPDPTTDVVLANLFLHHFSTEQLRYLLQLVAARTKWMIACEPSRSRFGLAGVQMLPLIGCNSVTRHDADISVRAGFAGRELSSLWPDHTQWELQERPVNLFSHLFTARRCS